MAAIVYPPSDVTDLETDWSDEDLDSPRTSIQSLVQSQSTLSLDDLPTPGLPTPGLPTPDPDPQDPRFGHRWPKAVEGPRGPHLFRASQDARDLTFYLSLSPLTPGEDPKGLGLGTNLDIRGVHQNACLHQNAYREKNACLHQNAYREKNRRQPSPYLNQGPGHSRDNPDQEGLHQNHRQDGETQRSAPDTSGHPDPRAPPSDRPSPPSGLPPSGHSPPSDPRAPSGRPPPSGHSPPSTYGLGPVHEWSPAQVTAWLSPLLPPPTLSTFERNDISGRVLLDLKFHHLKELDIPSLGKRHQLWAAIHALRQGQMGRGGQMGQGGQAPAEVPDSPDSEVEEEADDEVEEAEEVRRSRSNRVRQSRQSSHGPWGPPRRQTAAGLPGHPPGHVSASGDLPGLPTSYGAAAHQQTASGALPGVLSPADSVSIVGIEQLLPRPHKCSKGDRCPKFRRQQRQYAWLNSEYGGNGQGAISPEDGGRIVVTGDPGNPQTARKQHSTQGPTTQGYSRPTASVPGQTTDTIGPTNDPTTSTDRPASTGLRPVSGRPVSGRPVSEAVPSVVASSDVLGPGPPPRLAEDTLRTIPPRDPQENVKHFLSFQHLTPSPDTEEMPLDLFPTRAPMAESLRQLPRLSIPGQGGTGLAGGDPAGTDPGWGDATAVPRDNAVSPARTITPGAGAGAWRGGTPFSEMDAPTTAIPLGPVARDFSQSVPPDMRYREAGGEAVGRADGGGRPEEYAWERTHPDASSWDGRQHEWEQTDRSRRRSGGRRPSFAIPTSMARVPEEPAQAVTAPPRGQSASVPPLPSQTAGPSSQAASATPGQAATPGASHSGFMKKRRTRFLRHEWHESHFRLRGTQLAMHPDARATSAALDRIDVDDYAVACEAAASGRKLTTALRLGKGDPTKLDPSKAFAFQLVPERRKFVGPGAKAHHFAVTSRDERIDWMRELLLAKALRQKRMGYDVTVAGDGSS